MEKKAVYIIFHGYIKNALSGLHGIRSEGFENRYALHNETWKFAEHRKGKPRKCGRNPAVPANLIDYVRRKCRKVCELT